MKCITSTFKCLYLYLCIFILTHFMVQNKFILASCCRFYFELTNLKNRMELNVSCYLLPQYLISYQFIIVKYEH